MVVSAAVGARVDGGEGTDDEGKQLEGVHVGWDSGSVEGSIEDLEVGSAVGEYLEGPLDSKYVGILVGDFVVVGRLLGLEEGTGVVGRIVGEVEGRAVGKRVGLRDLILDGARLGNNVTGALDEGSVGDVDGK